PELRRARVDVAGQDGHRVHSLGEARSVQKKTGATLAAPVRVLLRAGVGDYSSTASSTSSAASSTASAASSMASSTASAASSIASSVASAASETASPAASRSEEHTSELQSRENIVCR